MEGTDAGSLDEDRAVQAGGIEKFEREDVTARQSLIRERGDAIDKKASAEGWLLLFGFGPAAAAAIALSAAAVLTVPIVVIAFLTGWLWGTLLLPYQIWVALAASLSWGYLHLNG